jgi:hypothetical protein
MFRKRRKTSDFDAEIEAHLQLEADRLQEQGMSESFSGHHGAEIRSQSPFWAPETGNQHN